MHLLLFACFSLFKWSSDEHKLFLLLLHVLGFYFFFPPHPRICSLILEEKKGQREKQNIDPLPPVCTRTQDQTRNLRIDVDFLCVV